MTIIASATRLWNFPAFFFAAREEIIIKISPDIKASEHLNLDTRYFRDNVIIILITSLIERQCSWNYSLIILIGQVRIASNMNELNLNFFETVLIV